MAVSRSRAKDLIDEPPAKFGRGEIEVQIPFYCLGPGEPSGGADIRRGHGCQFLGPLRDWDFRSLVLWAVELRAEGIPANVSYHAGEYLCNATLYLSHYYAERLQARTQSAFIHLPLAYSQTVQGREQMPAMPSEMAAHALRLIVDQLLKPEPARQQELA